MQRRQLFGVLTGILLIAGAIRLSAHETKEIAGLEVTFGAEPEPAITGQFQYLRWRFRSKATKENFTELEQLTATIKKDGKESGPFAARLIGRDPGLVQTQHIFTAPGEHEVVLSFKKKGDTQDYSIAFTFQIQDRKELEIP